MEQKWVMLKKKDVEPLLTIIEKLLNHIDNKVLHAPFSAKLMDRVKGFPYEITDLGEFTSDLKNLIDTFLKNVESEKDERKLRIPL